MKLSNKVISALCLPSNAHLRRVNSAFSGFASLEIPLVIQLLTKLGVSKKLVRHSQFCFCHLTLLF